MIFMCYLILFAGFHGSTARDIKVTYNFIKWVLDFFRSPSVILVFDDQRRDGGGNLGDIGLYSINFLRLQMQLSSDFYLSSLFTLSTDSKAFRNRFQNGKETVVVLGADEFLVEFIEKLSSEMDISSYKWLITSTFSSEKLEKLIIPLASEFVFAQGDDVRGYDLSEIYDTRSGGKVTKALGRWVADGSFVMTSSEDLFSRRKNLNGTAIKVLSSREDPCVENSFNEGVAPVVECIHKTIWDTLAEMLNATTEVVLTPHLNRDSIQKSDAEITFRSAPLNSYDMNTRWYLWPLFRTKVEVVTSHLPQQVEWRTYILPFSGQMWFIVLIWLVLCDFIMTAIKFMKEWRKNEISFWQCYGEFLFTAAFILFNQEVLAPSELLSLRIIFIMMFVVSGVLFPGYSASLTSFLTVSLYREPFKNLEELSRTEYKLGWHRSFPLDNMFNMNDKSPLNAALLQNNVLPQEKMPSTDIEAVERMCNEKFTFLTSEETILALKPTCSYYKLKQHFKTVFTSMEMKKGSWYHYFLNRCERKLEFTGTAFRIKLHAVMQYFIYKEQQLVIERDVPPIMIQNIVLPFAVLLLGVIFSAFLLVLEITCYKSLSKRAPPSQCSTRVVDGFRLRT